MDDSHSTVTGRRRAPMRRGPLVVTNPGNDSDEDVSERPTAPRKSHYNVSSIPIQTQPSPISYSPRSEQSSLPSTSLPPPSHIPSHTIPTDNAAQAGQSNPSLSSPSGSSSPAVESTPPPSTPGQSAPADDGGNIAERSKYAPLDDNRQDVRQQNGSSRSSVMDKIRNLPNALHARVPRQAPVSTTNFDSLFL